MKKLECTTCRTRKATSEFTPSILKAGKKICRACKRLYNRSWYDRNKSKHCADVVQNSARHKAKLRALIARLKSRPCADCGGRFPPIAMDFDHVRGEKVDIVSALPARMFSVKRLMEEVAKCDVVCAICHRIRTGRRLQEAGQRVYGLEVQPTCDDPGGS